jgi:DNA processing protein
MGGFFEMGERLKYWVGFNKVPGIGPIRIKQILDSFGDIEAAWHASYDDLKQIGLGLKIIDEFIRIRSELDLDAELERILSKGIKVISWDSEDYPVRLRGD